MLFILYHQFIQSRPVLEAQKRYRQVLHYIETGTGLAKIVEEKRMRKEKG